MTGFKNGERVIVILLKGHEAAPEADLRKEGIMVIEKNGYTGVHVIGLEGYSTDPEDSIHLVRRVGDTWADGGDGGYIRIEKITSISDRFKVGDEVSIQGYSMTGTVRDITPSVLVVLIGYDDEENPITNEFLLQKNGKFKETPTSDVSVEIQVVRRGTQKIPADRISPRASKGKKISEIRASLAAALAQVMGLQGPLWEENREEIRDLEGTLRTARRILDQIG